VNKANFGKLAGKTQGAERTVESEQPQGRGESLVAQLDSAANQAEQLREQHDVLPREPLDIHLMCAEISELARNYANDLLFELRTSLEAQAIFVESEFIAWDATDTMSTL
jgi:hypothetical protein